MWWGVYNEYKSCCSGFNSINGVHVWSFVRGCMGVTFWPDLCCWGVQCACAMLRACHCRCHFQMHHFTSQTNREWALRKCQDGAEDQTSERWRFEDYILNSRRSWIGVEEVGVVIPLDVWWCACRYTFIYDMFHYSIIVVSVDDDPTWLSWWACMNSHGIV